MELRVESAQGYRLPNDCYVGIRVGDVLKQGRYEPQRCYHFPQVDRRRNAKIDIYQHIGTCVVAVDPDTKAQHEVNVSSADPSMPGAKLLVNVQSRTDDNTKQQRDERTKALKNQAKEYLSKHSIEERLSEAVKALLKEQPEDPTLFLCNHLGGSPPSKADSKLETAGKVDASAKTAEVEAPPPAKEPPAKEPVAIADTKAAEKEEPVAIPDSKASARAKAANVLIKAAEDGSLEQALQETKQELRGDNQGTNQTVRNKAAQLLTAAADSGALEQALRESLGPQQGDPNAAVRLKAANLLTQAAESGDLERALVEVIGPSAKQNSARERAAQVLTQAIENGDLERALDEVKGKDTQQSKTDNIRAKAAQVLFAAAENGTLEDALAETRGERQAATKPSQGLSAEDIRLLAGNILRDAVPDGRLENALREISAASVDTKQQGSDAVKAKAANLLLQAEGSGELEAIVKEVKRDKQGQGEKPKENVEPAVKSEADQGQVEKKQKTEQVRQKASNLLMNAAENGDLEKVLREVNNNKGSKVDSSPPIVMNSMAMGPAYNTMGMQPGLLFI